MLIRFYSALIMCLFGSRGGSALSGFAGAAIYPYCQRTFGLWRTGQWAIVQQLVFVSIAAAPLYMYGHQQGVTTAAFVLATAVVSALLMWVSSPKGEPFLIVVLFVCL